MLKVFFAYLICISATFLYSEYSIPDYKNYEQKYIIITKTVPQGKNSGDSRSNDEHRVVLSTDSFTGLKPGYFIIVDSAFETEAEAGKWIKNIINTVPDAYIRNTGLFIPLAIPDLITAEKLLKNKLTSGSIITFKLEVSIRKRTIPLFLVQTSRDTNLDPCDERGFENFSTALYTCLVQPVMISRTIFSPVDEGQCWIDNSCKNLKVYHLVNKMPVILAQKCSQNNLTVWKFAVIGNQNLHSPAYDSARFETSVLPTGLHEYFIPSLNKKDFEKHDLLNKIIGDGKSLVAALQGRIEANDDNNSGTTYQIRIYRAIWNGNEIIKTFGNWENDE